jgi:hypothetical protein
VSRKVTVEGTVFIVGPDQVLGSPTPHEVVRKHHQDHDVRSFTGKTHFKMRCYTCKRVIWEEREIGPRGGEQR